MSTSFIIIALLCLAGVIAGVIINSLFKTESPESNFIQKDEIGTDGEIKEALPEYADCQEKQSGILGALMKRAPKTIMTLVAVNLIIGFTAGRISNNTAEKLGIVITAFSYGEYATAVTALWSIGKPELVEQTRVTLGSHPDQEELGIEEFIYVGRPFGKNLAILPRLYSTQDHDKNLKKSDLNYGNVLLMPFPDAQMFCQEKYNADVISIEEWQVVTNHIRASIKIKAYPKTPEWTRNAHEDDEDDYLVIAKKSGIRDYVKSENIDSEDDGLYVDGDDLLTAGFRCSKTWESNDASR